MLLLRTRTGTLEVSFRPAIETADPDTTDIQPSTSEQPETAEQGAAPPEEEPTGRGLAARRPFTRRRANGNILEPRAATPMS